MTERVKEAHQWTDGVRGISFFPARWKNCLVFQELFPGFEAAKSPESLRNVLILSEVMADERLMG